VDVLDDGGSVAGKVEEGAVAAGDELGVVQRGHVVAFRRGRSEKCGFIEAKFISVLLAIM
jgi:hypothetical protein